MKVAIISCTSQLADKILVNTIAQLGKENVIGVCRSPEKMEPKNYGIEIRKGDFADSDLLSKAFEGVKKVLLVSSNAKPSDRVQQHRNVINAAKNAGVEVFVYTSIIGVFTEVSKETGFSDVVKSNEQAEEDIKNSGMKYTIGRNSLYLDPDVESLEMYKKDGCIQNSGGSGKAGLITRDEMGYAYGCILAESTNKFDNKIFNVCGEGVTQEDLAKAFIIVFNLNISFKTNTVQEYYDDRKKAYGDYFGGIIGGIYHLMSLRGFEVESNFKDITSRNPQTIVDGIKSLQKK